MKKQKEISSENKLFEFVKSPKRIVFFFFASIIFTGFILINADKMQVFAVTGINQTINFQGKVVNSDGTNVVDGEYSFVFTLYDAASGGSTLWTETQANVQVTGGIFRVSLGSVNSLSGVDFNDDSIYLGINFNSDGEMTPRIRFASVPYALNAETVSGLTVTDTSGTLTIPDSKTVQFGGAFTTSAQDVTLTLTDTTNVTLPTSGTLSTLGGVETLTNKTIGSTGLTFSGASLDITTGTNEDLVISPNGTGKIMVQSQSGGDSALIVDKTGDGDIFSASSSGVMKFTITNDGALLLGEDGVGSSGECLKSQGAGSSANWGSCGGAINWDEIGDPTAGSAINMSGFAQSLDWGATADSALDALTISVTNTISSDSTTQRGLVIENIDDAGSNGATDVLLAITNSDTNEAVTTGISITSEASGITTALDLTDPDIISALSFAENNVLGTNFAITGSSGLTVIGAGENKFSFDPSSGPSYVGTARPTKTVSIHPEYAGAVLTAFYGGGADSSITGSMTSDTETTVANNLKNYYQWSSSEVSLNHYTVAVRIRLPKDFSAWATSNALQIDFVTEDTSTANNFFDARVYLESDITTAVASSTSNASSTGGTWATVTIDDSTLDDASAPEWDAADETAVIYLRMGSTNSNYVRIGEIRLNYLSSF